MKRRAITFALIFGLGCFSSLAQLNVADIGHNNARKKILQIPIISNEQVLDRRRLEQRIHRLKEPEEYRHFDPYDQEGSGTGSETKLDLAALYQGYGTHYVDLWIGVPTPQRQTLIVDTGSSRTAFPCDGCKDCGLGFHTAAHYYDPSQSKTFHKLTCEECRSGSCKHAKKGNHAKDAGYCSLHQGYSEGSEWRAYEFLDYVYVGGHHMKPVNFTLGHKASIHSPANGEQNISPDAVLDFETLALMGCQTSVTGLFKTQLADGIMGMDKNSHAFWSQMYEYGSIDSPQFSLCFQNQNHADSDGTVAGVITFGGTDVALHEEPMQFANELQSHPSSYYVKLESMFLLDGRRGHFDKSLSEEYGDDILVELDGLQLHQLNAEHGAMVDSGTTGTYFPRAVTKPFKAAWYKLTGFDFDNPPSKITFKKAMALPTIVLKLEGATDVLQEEATAKEYSYDYDEYEDDDERDNGDSAGDDDDQGRRTLSTKQSVFLSITAPQYVHFAPSKDDDETGSVYFRVTLNHQKTTLGASTLIGHDFFFDNEHARVGFARSRCNYESLGPDHVIPVSESMSQSMRSGLSVNHNGSVKLYVSVVGLILFVLAIFTFSMRLAWIHGRVGVENHILSHFGRKSGTPAEINLDDRATGDENGHSEMIQLTSTHVDS